MKALISVIELGNNLALLYDDGSRDIAYTTGNQLWPVSAGSSTPPTSALFHWPFSLASSNMNNNNPGDNFRTEIRPEHNGMDFGFPPGAVGGAEIGAAGAGTVTTAEFDSGFGNHVIIDHGTISGINRKTLYAHMLDGSFMVGVSDVVALGQGLGLVGSTGSSTGNHLHLETWNDDVKVDPLLFMAELNPNNYAVRF